MKPISAQADMPSSFIFFLQKSILRYFIVHVGFPSDCHTGVLWGKACLLLNLSPIYI